MNKHQAWTNAVEQWWSVGHPSLTIRRKSVVKRYVIGVYRRRQGGTSIKAKDLLFEGCGETWEAAIAATAAAERSLRP